MIALPPQLRYATVQFMADSDFQPAAYDDQPQQPAPAFAPGRDPHFIVTPAIIAANALVFTGMVLTGSPIMGPGDLALLRWGANYGPPHLRRRATGAC